MIEGSANPQAGARITISYCTQCKWLLRAAWMAQELLSTFETDIAEVTLRPGLGGLFRSRSMASWSGIESETAASPT